MREDAAQIVVEYLPIHMQSQKEDEYQWYLFKTYEALTVESTFNIASFGMVPFHMLFMLAVQYKALRVQKAKPDQYGHAFTFRHIARDHHCSLLNPTSPYDFCWLSEKSLFDVFRIVGADDALISRAKAQVDQRNNLAHVNGVIETNIDETIEEYLAVLLELQKLFLPINDTIARSWLAEMEPEEDKAAFAELRLAADYLCHADFNDGLLKENFPR